MAKLKSELNGIEIPDYDYTWGIIDTCRVGPTIYHLLENEYYGDEAFYLIVNSDMEVILDDVSNGFEDLLYFLEN